METRYYVEERLAQFAVIDRTTGNAVTVSTAKFAADQIAQKRNAEDSHCRSAIELNPVTALILGLPRNF